MNTDRKWVVVRIDGKIAAVSTDYRMLSEIADKLSGQKTPQHQNISAETVDFDFIWSLRKSLTWDDFMLFGTEFQKKVWRKLYELTPKLLSYSDFAELCDNRAGVRSVAHAIALNPIPVIIPCHLVVPKEAIDRISDIHQKAESTIFKGNDLCLESILKEPGIDFGEYALGKNLKRQLIQLELK